MIRINQVDFGQSEGLPLKAGVHPNLRAGHLSEDFMCETCPKCGKVVDVLVDMNDQEVCVICFDDLMKEFSEVIEQIRQRWEHAFRGDGYAQSTR